MSENLDNEVECGETLGRDGDGVGGGGVGQETCQRIGGDEAGAMGEERRREWGREGRMGEGRGGAGLSAECTDGGLGVP